MPAAEVANAACRLSAAAPRPAVLTRGPSPPEPPQPWVAVAGQRPGPGTPQPCVAVGGQHPGPPDLHNLGLLTAVRFRAPGPPAGGCRGGLGSRGMAFSSSGMNLRALRTLSQALLRGYFRDRTALAFSILLPVLFLVLFGALYRDRGAPKLTVVEIGDVSLLSHVGGQPGLSGILTVSRAGDKKAAVREVRRGDADAAVEQAGRLLIVHYSIADPTTAGIVQTVFSSIVQHADQARAGPGSYQLLTKQVESTMLKPIQFLAPGLLGWAVASGAAFGAAITLVNWRQNKLLRRLRLAPVNTGSVVLARVWVALLVALIQTALFLIIATTPFFGLKLTHGWWAAIPVVLCGTLAFMSIGLLVGSFAKTQQAATAITNLIILDRK